MRRLPRPLLAGLLTVFSVTACSTLFSSWKSFGPEPLKCEGFNLPTKTVGLLPGPNPLGDVTLFVPLGSGSPPVLTVTVSQAQPGRAAVRVVAEPSTALSVPVVLRISYANCRLPDPEPGPFTVRRVDPPPAEEMPSRDVRSAFYIDALLHSFSDYAVYPP